MKLILLALLISVAVPLITGICANCKCEWRGQAPMCMGECEDGEHKIKEAATAVEAVPYEATFGKECWYGKKFYCCKRNETLDDSHLNRVSRFDRLSH